jgi:hypothetical protein
MLQWLKAGCAYAREFWRGRFPAQQIVDILDDIEIGSTVWDRIERGDFADVDLDEL